MVDELDSVCKRFGDLSVNCFVFFESFEHSIKQLVLESLPLAAQLTKWSIAYEAPQLRTHIYGWHVPINFCFEIQELYTHDRFSLQVLQPVLNLRASFDGRKIIPELLKNVGRLCLASFLWGQLDHVFTEVGICIIAVLFRPFLSGIHH